jgi:hypothetical protein
MPVIRGAKSNTLLKKGHNRQRSFVLTSTHLRSTDINPRYWQAEEITLPRNRGKETVFVALHSTIGIKGTVDKVIYLLADIGETDRIDNYMQSVENER